MTVVSTRKYSARMRSRTASHARVVMHRFMFPLGLGAALLAAGACDEQRPDSPLIQASRTGSLDAIKLLLEPGADVNLPGPTGDDWDATPLQHAILARQPGAVRLLLDRGADPNRSAGPKAVAPLMLAAGDTDPTFVNCCSPTEQTRLSEAKTESRRCLVRSPPARSTGPTVRCLAAAASKPCAR